MAKNNNANKKVETPKVETPKVETPKVETPKVETPKVETPKVETPKVETPKVEKPGKTNKELDEQMKPYLKAYPKEKLFWVSSDGQVFLSSNLSDAQWHQKHLDDKKALTEYTV